MRAACSALYLSCIIGELSRPSLMCVCNLMLFEGSGDLWGWRGCIESEKQVRELVRRGLPLQGQSAPQLVAPPTHCSFGLLLLVIGHAMVNRVVIRWRLWKRCVQHCIVDAWIVQCIGLHGQRGAIFQHRAQFPVVTLVSARLLKELCRIHERTQRVKF